MSRLSSDERFMRIALELAAKGRGKTYPNPMVGAVVVKDGKIVGRGYHSKAGEPHAEILALKKARGDTLYLTLEPCNTCGRTPPCAPHIVEAGIKRVVIAALDPNPVNHNNGIRYLRRHRIKVTLGVLKNEAIRLNELPYVTVKVAMSLDGKIATRTGSSKWISSKESRQFAAKLRRKADAVLVGRRTFLRDKPRLKGIKHKIFLPKGRIDLKKLLKNLAKQGIMHVLIEGGGETIASAIKAGLVDRLYIFIAPKIIGGRNAPTPVEGIGIKDISQALKVKDMKVQRIGEDILLTGYVHRNNN